MRLLLILFFAWLFAGNAERAGARRSSTGAHDPTLLIEGGDRWHRLHAPAKACSGWSPTDEGKTWQPPGKPIFSPGTGLVACMPCPRTRSLDVWAPKVFQPRGSHLAAVFHLHLRQEPLGHWPGQQRQTRLAATGSDDGLVAGKATATDNFNAIDADLFVDARRQAVDELWLVLGRAAADRAGRQDAASRSGEIHLHRPPQRPASRPQRLLDAATGSTCSSSLRPVLQAAPTARTTSSVGRARQRPGAVTCTATGQAT